MVATNLLEKMKVRSCVSGPSMLLLLFLSCLFSSSLEQAGNTGLSCQDNSGCFSFAWSTQVGYCVLPLIGPGKCSCVSGLGGHCDTSGPIFSADASCVPEVMAGYVDFAPSVISVSMLGSDIALQIAAPYQTNGNLVFPRDTTIFFGTTGETSCDYPYGDGSNGVTWSKLQALAINNCNDVYSGLIPLKYAIANCGFLAATIGNNLVINGVVRVQREYLVQLRPDLAMLRQLQSGYFPISLSLPQTVVLSTNVTVYGPISISVSVISSYYDPTTPCWVVVISTNVNNPYVLLGPIDVVSDNTARGLTAVGFSTQNSSCTGASNCAQQFIITFGGGGNIPACQAISNGGIVAAFTVSCQSEYTQECPLNPSPTEVSITINTPSACPSSAILTSTFDPYDSSSFTGISTVFTNGTTAFFLVTFQSTNSQYTITGVTFESANDVSNVLPATDITLSTPNQDAFSVPVSALPEGSVTVNGIFQVMLNNTYPVSGVKVSTSITVGTSNIRSPSSQLERSTCYACIIVPIVTGFVLIVVIVGLILYKAHAQSK